MDEGWYKFYRKLYTKPIWLKSTPEQKVILVALLGKANHKEKEWEWKGKQFKAKPGQFVTSINSIIDMCGKGISEQNVRTALKRFEKYEFLTQEVTKTGRLITIVNWGLYQGIELETNKETNSHLTKTSQRANKDLTDTSQSPNKDLTPNKNDKNISSLSCLNENLLLKFIIFSHTKAGNLSSFTKSSVFFPLITPIFILYNLLN